VLGEKGVIVYQVIENWASFPADWYIESVADVAVDSRDRIWLFTRSEHPVMAFDRDGNFLTSWGEGMFTRAHGLTIGPDDKMYLVDDFAHVVFKCNLDGKLLLTLGTPHQPSDTSYTKGDYLSVKQGGPPFNRPTKVGLSPEGYIYVADGYYNARVHKFSPQGKLVLSWGEPGSNPGQFRLVHGVCVDDAGIVYVSDRMNSRVQVFSPDGEYITQWNDVYQGNNLCWDGIRKEIITAEMGYRTGIPLSGPSPAPESPEAAVLELSRVTIRSRQGNILAKIVNRDPRGPGGFKAAHGVCVDSHGDIYVGESFSPRFAREGAHREDYHRTQKLVRVR
jgi:sugar lactone lactonase YvrE